MAKKPTSKATRKSSTRSSAVSNDGFETLQQGQRVEFDIADEPTAPQSRAANMPGTQTSRRAADIYGQLQVPDRYFKPPTVPLPDEWLPDPENIVVLDAGGSVSSVGFATAAMINYLRRERGHQELASPWMLQANARKWDEFDDASDAGGSSLRGAMIGWWQHGVCSAQDWPTEDALVREDVLQQAINNKPSAFARVRGDVESLRAAVYHVHAVVAAAAVHDGWYKVAPNGTIEFRPHVPLFQQGSTVVGLLPFAVIGYTATGFIVQNCWGSSWNTVHVGGRQFPGCAIWSYQDAEQNLVDAWAGLVPGTRRVKRIWRPGFKTDSVEGEVYEGDDRLGVLTEVRALSAIVATHDIEPPLSIGLFGDWGTGKSFFMRQMQRHIRDIDRAAAKDVASPYCTNIVQIRFNAWHYLDTNLWASLVSQIFGALLSHIEKRETDEQKREKIRDKLRAESQLLQAQQKSLEAAQQAEVKAEELLTERQQKLNDAELNLAAARDDLITLFREHPALQGQLQGVLAGLGVKTAINRLSDLHREAKEVSAAIRPISLVWSHLKRPEGRTRRITLLAVAAAIAFGLPIVLTLLSGQLAGLMTAVSDVIALLGAGVLWVKPYVKKLQNYAVELSTIVQQIDDQHKARIDELTQPQHDEVQKRRAALREAQNQVTATQARVTQLTMELARLEPTEQLRDFILSRGNSSDYTKQLGIVSMVRADFERLSALIKQNEEARRKRALDPTSEGEPETLQIPVQRIVLYIDDLDRCTAERVVAVLEAVHLLLAFRLFVVVVAVDPRWLRRSLEKTYPDLLGVPGRAAEQDIDAVRPSTPQDYLEKIFQIPLYLRPISADGYQSLIEHLAATDVVADEATLSDAQSRETPASQPGGRMIHFPEGVGDEEFPIEEAEIDPEQLRFRSWELKDMGKLSPLFRTPRAVKRFVNTYRLLRAMVEPARVASFEGTAATPGAYRWPMMLLGIVAGYPNTGLRFVLMLTDACKRKPGMSTIDFLNSIGQTNPEDRFAEEWQQLNEGVKALEFPASIDAFQPWLASVARFSFSPEGDVLGASASTN